MWADSEELGCAVVYYKVGDIKYCYASATKHLGIGMSVGLSVGWSVSTQLSKKFKMCSFNNTFPAEAYSCLQVCVFIEVHFESGKIMCPKRIWNKLGLSCTKLSTAELVQQPG